MEKRVDRLEKKIDEVKEEVTELKTDFKVHTELMKEHVAGDSKIIQQIQPLLEVLPSLRDIVQEYHLDKLAAKRKAETRKVLIDKIKIISGVISIVGLISAYFLS